MTRFSSLFSWPVDAADDAERFRDSSHDHDPPLTLLTTTSPQRRQADRQCFLSVVAVAQSPRWPNRRHQSSNRNRVL